MLSEFQGLERAATLSKSRPTEILSPRDSEFEATDRVVQHFLRFRTHRKLITKLDRTKCTPSLGFKS